mgnify:CR=1 FL=1
MKVLNVILIGAGDRGNTYTRIMSEMPEQFKVVAVAEPNESRRNRIRERHNIPAEQCFKDWKDLLALGKIADVAIIATMDRQHFEPTMKAIQLKYDILLEKPVSPNPKECIQIAESAKENGVSILVCHVLRYTQLFMTLKNLIDDGKIELSVLEIKGTEIKCLVVNGGKLGNTRGVNIPDVHINMPFISEKDADDLKFGVEQGIDLVAASFVRSKQDILDMRSFLDSVGGKEVKIIAKIENRFGIEYFDDILSVSDGIMVARGDMGVEVPFEKLPAIQKKLIKKCFLNGKMAITATQMLESMIENASPTRAEISDVANAVFDSTSAVMLSGETAIGKNPAAVVGVMAKICETAEKDAFKLGVYDRLGQPGEHGSFTDAICSAANVAANAVGADAVIAVTGSGDTARNMSKYRPSVNIIGATYNVKSYHQLSVNWGVIPLLTERQAGTDELFSHAVSKAMQNGLIRKGDRTVITAGSPVGINGKTNTLKIVEA